MVSIFQIIFNESEYFFSFYLRFEKAKQSIYHRTYKKLGNVLADIGGIAKALMMIGFLICLPINKLTFSQSLSNQLFNFNEDLVTNNQNTLCQQNQNDKKFETTNQVNIPNKLKPSLFNLDQNKKLPQTSSINNLSMDFFSQNVMSPKKKQIILEQDSHQEESSKSKEFPSLPPEKSRFSFQNDHFRQLEGFDQQLQEGEYEQKSQFEINYSKLLDLKNQIKSNIASSSSRINIIASPENGLDPERSNQALEKYEESEKEIKGFQSSPKMQIEQNNKLFLKWIDYIKYYFWPFGQFKKKKEMIDYSNKRVRQCLDMVFFISKLIELEKLKSILLDEDQLSLVQFIPKPCIHAEEILSQKNNKNENKKSINMLNNVLFQDDNEKARSAVIGLRNILRKKSLTKIDKKIIEMIDVNELQNLKNNKGYQFNLDDQAFEDEFDGATYNIEKLLKEAPNDKSPVKKDRITLSRSKMKMPEQLTQSRDQSIQSKQMNTLISPRRLEEQSQIEEKKSGIIEIQNLDLSMESYHNQLGDEKTNEINSPISNEGKTVFETKIPIFDVKKIVEGKKPFI